ncbi:hypothetical protein ACJ73_01912 [Blastomyces percursus]|uniref:Uncharacterized protein n=1 Tax=Blastomyces percursus TaxID=1658174 RepID=A0A1J9QE11_9EURO|nr:hypothetical protein ACJ73_01912 [Blastomyces percursus]
MLSRGPDIYHELLKAQELPGAESQIPLVVCGDEIGHLIQPGEVPDPRGPGAGIIRSQWPPPDQESRAAQMPGSHPVVDPESGRWCPGSRRCKIAPGGAGMGQLCRTWRCSRAGPTGQNPPCSIAGSWELESRSLPPRSEPRRKNTVPASSQDQEAAILPPKRHSPAAWGTGGKPQSKQETHEGFAACQHHTSRTDRKVHHARDRTTTVLAKTAPQPASSRPASLGRAEKQKGMERLILSDIPPGQGQRGTLYPRPRQRREGTDKEAYWHV